MLKRIAATATIAALTALPAMAETPKDTFVMAWNLDALITMDPAQIGEVNGNEIMTNVCDRLVAFDFDDVSKIVPRLAESWSMSEDGLSLTFKIRKGLKHPTGNPVTAGDAAWSMQRVLALNFGDAATLREWGFTKELSAQQFTAPDDNTLLVKLDKPYPPQLILSSLFVTRSAFILDRQEIEKHVVNNDLGNAWLKTNSACVGPYRLRTWNANDVVILERNEDWWDKKPAMRRIIVRHVPESGAERLQLEKGDIDAARLLNAQDLEAVDNSSNLRLQLTATHGYTYLSFNLTDPILSNPKVRLAFRYLVDYKGLESTVMKYQGIARASVVPIGAFGALSKEEGLPFKLDIDKAKQILAEAGYPQGFKKKLILSANNFNPALAQHIQGNAAKAGITLELEQMADAQLFTRTRSRDYEISQIGWQTGYPDANSMISRHGINPDNSAEAKLAMYPSWRAAFQDLSINADTDKAMFEKDPAKRIAIYHSIQMRLMETGPMAYMFQPIRPIALRKEVKVFKENAFRVGYETIDK
ncbi:MAG: ABC transporter substrate-binding protein [Proteobacteria bacterium]|nr:ABC transporter substrate-binding protein [Pseudomonadota bacterium]MBI3499302.1 ABC transporter substrate-binding protein [Pseudomonadota bacterium]